MSPLIPVEPLDAVAHVLHILIRKCHIHRQHEHSSEQPVGIWQVLCEPKRFQLVDGLATPLDQRADPVLSQILLTSFFGWEKFARCWMKPP